MSHLQTVTDAAKRLKLLDATGKLIALDSLTLVDLVTEIEDMGKVEIPTSEIRAEAFRSVETIAALLERLNGK